MPECKIALVSICVCLFIVVDVNAQFRGYDWGTSMNEIINTEESKGADVKTKNNLVEFRGRIMGMDCDIKFFFLNYELFQGWYDFVNVYKSKGYLYELYKEKIENGEYDSDFKKLTELLTNKYGRPTKEYDDGAVRQVHWETDKISIALMLDVRDEYVAFSLVYSMLKDDEEKRLLEDL